MGAAFLELNGKLSRNSFLTAPSASVAPVIILISDGMPTDDWKSGLAALKGNNWFVHAVKSSLAIGTELDRDVLEEFTGNPNTVLTVNNSRALHEMIRKVTINSSMIGTRSTMLDGEFVPRQEALGKTMDHIQEEYDHANPGAEVDFP